MEDGETDKNEHTSQCSYFDRKMSLHKNMCRYLLYLANKITKTFEMIVNFLTAALPVLFVCT